MAALPREDDTQHDRAPTRWPDARRLLEVGLVLAVLALCLSLRVVHLDALPVFFDEGVDTRAAQVVGAAPGPAAALVSLQYGAPPLFSWLAAPATRLLADPLLAARLTSALIGALTALGVWAIARNLSPASPEAAVEAAGQGMLQYTLGHKRGARAYSDTPLRLWCRHDCGLPCARARGLLYGSLAALLYALCPFALFYNRMALLDGLLAACGAGALFFALRLARDARGRDALALGLCLGAAMLTKIFAVSMLLLPLLAVVAARPGRRQVVRRHALMAAALGLLPLVALVMTPQGGGLLSATHAHAHSAEGLLATIVHQVATWGTALWLYLTPPVLLMALLGLWALRRERAALLIGPWAILGGLPPVVIPGAFLAPRYFLYSAVPIVVLAAYGFVALAAAIGTLVGRFTNRRPGILTWVLIILCGGLVAIPAVRADAAIIGTPARTPLIPFDRWQYVTGWPSGYALMDAISYLRREERHELVTIVSSIYNPPGDALTVLLGHDRRITLANRDFATLRRQPLHVAPGTATFVIACRPYGQPLHPNRRSLRLVLHAPNADGVGGVDLYKVVGQ